MMTATKTYQVRKVDGGYQVWYCNGKVERPVDGEKVYPSRQNAYARAHTMNQSAMTTTIDVSLTVQRGNCLSVVDALREERNLKAHVEDSLRNGEYAEERRITFSYLCRGTDTDMPNSKTWQKQPLTVQEFTGWLQSLTTNHEEIEHVHALIGGMPYEW